MEEENLYVDKQGIESDDVSKKVVDIVHQVDGKFWIPGVDNGLIGKFVQFVLTNNLQKKFTAYDQSSGEDFADYVARICKEIDETCYIPAVGNKQIGEFVRFCSEHNLWEKFREVLD